MHKIGFGVVRAGLIAPFHLKAIRDSDGGQTIGIFDVDHAKAEKLASEFNARTYASLTEMLEDDRINAICVMPPTKVYLGNSRGQGRFCKIVNFGKNRAADGLH